MKTLSILKTTLLSLSLSLCYRFDSLVKNFRCKRKFGYKVMALTNFILTVAGVSAVVLLLRSDVKQSAAIFRRNVKHIRNWLEEESSAASKAAEKVKPKELESKVPPKEKD
ncbi:hypothetical protein POUND7_020622 [Theobroma cacao]